MKHQIALLCLLLAYHCPAQRLFESKAFDWEEHPTAYRPTVWEKSKPEVILDEDRICEYYYNSGELFYASMFHRTVLVNHADAIDRNNKIYLPVSSSGRVLREKARVIKPDGKIWESDKKNIKEGIDEKSGNPFRYFALEGLEPGCVVEQIIEFFEPADYYGREIVLQSNILKRKVDFRLITPANLIFAVRSFQGLPQPVYDTLANGKNVWNITLDTLEGIEEERFAPYESAMGRVNFKLDRNTVTGKGMLVNFIEASKTIYTLTHEEAGKAARKAISRLIRESGVRESDPVETKIRTMEEYLKTHFSSVENSDLPGDIESIIKNKTCRERDLVKLYIMVFEEMGTNTEVVLTTNRYEQRFEPKFESYNFLDEFLLYFPLLDKYMCPTAFLYRMDLVPPGYINNYGLFVSAFEMGDVRTGVGEVRYIKPNDYQNTTHNIFVDVDFTRALDNPPLKYEITFTGYYAQSFQPVYGYLESDRQEELIRDLFENFIPGGHYSNTITENMGAEHFMLKPMVVKTEILAPQLVEKAGDEYVFKVGLLIGPQSQLYSEKPRTMDVENDFNRAYHREIVVIIPPGYSVGNMEALNIREVMLKDGNESSGFVSQAEITHDGRLKIVVDEFYRELCYPRTDYEMFRRVINAAADFNKIAIVLKKN